MTKLVFLLTLISIWGSFSCVRDSQINEAIQNLSVSDHAKQDAAIRLLLDLNKNNNHRLRPYKKQLSNVINQEISRSEFNYPLYLLALDLAEAEIIELNEYSEDVLTHQHNKLSKNLKQVNDYHTWIWNDTLYMGNRAFAGLILDILGYGSTQRSHEELERALEYYKDNKLKFFALSSLLNRKTEVPNEYFEYIAADDETRGLLFSYLKKVDKLYLFPDSYFTQENLSRTNMVNWLIYPTELGRVPTEIELIRVFSVRYPEIGETDFYLWKFRSDADEWKSEDWMVGLSGPFEKSKGPNLDPHGYTFSVFSGFEEKSAEAHFKEIMDVVDGWNTIES